MLRQGMGTCGLAALSLSVVREGQGVHHPTATVFVPPRKACDTINREIFSVYVGGGGGVEEEVPSVRQDSESTQSPA